MAKIQTLDDCVLELNGTRICAFCGAELEDGAVCTCNRYNSAVYNFSQIDGYKSRIADYQQRCETLLNNMPAPRYEIAEAVVPVPPTPEPPAEGNGGNGDNGEPTEGGGE